MKTKTKILLIISLIVILVIISLALLTLNNPLTGNLIREQESSNSTYTKAICNSSNFCQDNEITCQGNKTILVKPITGAVIQHSQDWIDPRNKEYKDKLC
jgi:hypothetical protein